MDHDSDNIAEEEWEDVLGHLKEAFEAVRRP
jgi:hypothetical protein